MIAAMLSLFICKVKLLFISADCRSIQLQTRKPS